MKYFVDTEFSFIGSDALATIFPISVGIVDERGREFYRVNKQIVQAPGLVGSPFIDAFVLPVLAAHEYTTMKLRSIRDALLIYVGDDVPEFWGDYAAFDYVVLSTIMGGFESWPNWPMWINDLQQLGATSLPSQTPHNALSDARAVKASYEAFVAQEISR